MCSGTIHCRAPAGRSTVVGARHHVGRELAVPGILFLELQVPVPPLHPKHIRSHVNHEAVSTGQLLAFPEEEIGHFDPVDRAIIGYFPAGNPTPSVLGGRLARLATNTLGNTRHDRCCQRSPCSRIRREPKRWLPPRQT